MLKPAEVHIIDVPWCLHRAPHGQEGRRVKQYMGRRRQTCCVIISVATAESAMSVAGMPSCTSSNAVRREPACNTHMHEGKHA